MSDICVSWLPLPLPVSPLTVTNHVECEPWSQSRWGVCRLCCVSKLEQNWNGTWDHSMFN